MVSVLMHQLAGEVFASDRCRMVLLNTTTKQLPHRIAR